MLYIIYSWLSYFNSWEVRYKNILRAKEVNDMLVKPYTPEDARKQNLLPDDIVAAINKLLSQKYSEKQIDIYGSEIIEIVGTKYVTNSAEREYDVAKIWPNIAPFYKKAGWYVHHIDNGYGDHFIFKIDNGKDIQANP